MHITINPVLFEKVPHFKIGIIHYNKIIVSDSPQMIKGRMQLYQENLFFDFQESPVIEQPAIKEWRTTLKFLGADPNRDLHSAESLLHRIAKQQYLMPLHTAVDLNNFFSLQYGIPVGIYDTAHIDGDILFSLGTEQVGYDGLNGRFNSLKNLPYTQDAQGAFGSLYVDSTRTATSVETTDALQIFYLLPSMNETEAMQLLTSAGNMFTQVCGGAFTPTILNALNPST